MQRFVAYYRVSTQKQGVTGLGLQAQRAAVAAHIGAAGGELVGEFEEVESGSRTSRQQLDAAIRMAKASRAVIVIAKLDRLARNVHFISRLMESGIEFVAADMPYANRLTIHIIAAVAEYERDLTSKRTREALARAKANGKKLGNPHASAQSALARKRASEMADRFASSVAPHIRSLQAHGIGTLSGLARAMNGLGVRTQRGSSWTAAGVSNVLQRLERLDANQRVVASSGA